MFSLFCSGYLAFNFSFSERFGDEIGHFVSGSRILKNEKLYQDLQLNHQPLVYYFSALVEFVTHPTTLSRYILFQRLAVFVYGAFWEIIFWLSFGLAGVFFGLLFETSKYFLSGYKLLGETLAVYPLVFLFGLLFKLFIKKQRILFWEKLLFSISFFLCAFSLLPLWPALCLITLFVCFKYFKNTKELVVFFGPALLLTGLLFLLVPIFSYFKETIFYNTKYFLPGGSNLIWPIDYLKIFVIPLSFLWSQFNNLSIILIGLFVAQVFLFQTFLKKKVFIYWVLLLFLSLLSNNRITEVSSTSFHLLPWLGVYAFLIINGLVFLFENKNNYIIKCLLLLFVILIFNFGLSKFLWIKKDRATEFYINYSETLKNSVAVNCFKDKTDRLIAFPNNPLINWVTNLKSGTRIFEYYSWIFNIPEYRNELKYTFSKNPPEFFVSTDKLVGDFSERTVLPSLRKNYLRLNYLNKPSELYVLKSKANKFSDEQWNKCQESRFTK